MKQLLKNGTVVSGDGTKVMDLLIDGETIVRAEEGISDPDAEETDMTGKMIFPGFIDAHTHMGLHVGGTVTADDFRTGTAAAIAGGTTMLIDFGTQYHGESLNQGLANWFKMADCENSCDYSFHMSISEWTPEVSRQVDDMAGYPVVILECSNPTAIRREAAFSEAVRLGRKTVEGIECIRLDSAEQALKKVTPKQPVLLVDEEADSLPVLRPEILIDAILAKRNLGTRREMAELTIGVGPGFTAGIDTDYVVETMRGHNLGRVFHEGMPTFDVTTLSCYSNPPFFYVICALILQIFHDGFGWAIGTTLHFLQCVNSIYVMVGLFAGFGIVSKFGVKGRKFIASILFLTFFPAFYNIGATLNNDALCYMCMSAASA